MGTTQSNSVGTESELFSIGGYAADEYTKIEQLIIDLKSYPQSVTHLKKIELIKKIGVATSRLGLKVDMSSPEKIVASVRQQLPDPDVKGSKFKGDNKKLNEIVLAIATVFNDVFSSGSNKKIIDITQSAQQLMKEVSHHVYGISCGLNIEFYRVYNTLKRSIEQLDGVSTALDVLIDKKGSVAYESANDVRAKGNIKELVLAAEGSVKEFRKVLNTIRMATNILATEEDQIIIELEKHKKKYDQVDLYTEDDNDTYGETIARMLSSVGNVSILTERVNTALEKTGVTLKQYKDFESVGTMMDHLYNKIREMDPKSNEKEISEVLTYMDDLTKYWGRRKQVVGGGGCGCTSDNVFGGDEIGGDGKLGLPMVTGGTKKALDPNEIEQLARRKRAETAIKQFVRRLNEELNEFVSISNEMALKLGDAMYDTDKLERFVTSLAFITKLRDSNLYLALIGYNVDETYNIMASSYRSELKTSMSLLSELGNSYSTVKKETNKMESVISNILKHVDFFKDLLKTLFIGVNQFEVMSVIRDIPTSIYTVTSAIRRLHHAVYISKMRRGIKISSKNLKHYSGKYVDLLSQAVGEKRRKLDADLDAVMKSVEEVDGSELKEQEKSIDWIAKNIYKQPGYFKKDQTWYENMYKSDNEDAANVVTVNDTGDVVQLAAAARLNFNNYFGADDGAGVSTNNVTGRARLFKYKLYPSQNGQPPDANHTDIGRELNKIYQSKESEKRIEKFKDHVKSEHNAKVRFYKALESLDILLGSFTSEMVGDVDLLKEVKKYLDDTKVYTRWFTDYTGDVLSSVFESMGDDLPKYDEDLVNKNAAGVVVTDAAGGGAGGGVGGAVNAANTELFADSMLGAYTGTFNDDRDYTLGNRPPAAIETDGKKEYMRSILDSSKYYKSLQDRVTKKNNVPRYGKVSSVIDIDKADDVKKNIETYYNNFQALLNIMHSFTTLYNRMVDKEVKQAIMSPVQIYFSFISYLKASALARRKNAYQHGIPGRTNAINKITGLIMPGYYPKPKDNQGKYNHAWLNTVENNDNIASAAVGKQVGIDAPVAIDNRIVGTYKRGINESYESVFKDEDQYFAQAMKAISSSVLSVLGLYHVSTQPVNIGTMYSVRSIMGGASLELPFYEDPTKIPDLNKNALDLYYYLPQLILFYREVFENDKDNSPDSRKITLTQDFIGTFGKLIYVVFNKRGNMFNDIEIKAIIAEINKAYTLYAKESNPVDATIRGLVDEVNRRFSLVKDKEATNVAKLYEERLRAESGNINKEYDTTGRIALEGEYGGEDDDKYLDGIMTPSDAMLRITDHTNEKKHRDTLRVKYPMDGMDGADETASWSMLIKLRKMRAFIDDKFDSVLRGDVDKEGRDTNKDYAYEQSYDTAFGESFYKKAMMHAHSRFDSATGAPDQLRVCSNLINNNIRHDKLDMNAAFMFSETVATMTHVIRSVKDILRLYFSDILAWSPDDIRRAMAAEGDDRLLGRDFDAMIKLTTDIPIFSMQEFTDRGITGYAAAGAAGGGGGGGGANDVNDAADVSSNMSNLKFKNLSHILGYKGLIWFLLNKRNIGRVIPTGSGITKADGQYTPYVSRALENIFGCPLEQTPGRLAYASLLNAGDISEPNLIEFGDKPNFMNKVIEIVLSRFDMGPIYTSAVGACVSLSSSFDNLISMKATQDGGLYLDTSKLKVLLTDGINDCKRYLEMLRLKVGDDIASKYTEGDSYTNIYQMESEINKMFNVHYIDDMSGSAATAAELEARRINPQISTINDTLASLHRMVKAGHTVNKDNNVDNEIIYKTHHLGHMFLSASMPPHSEPIPVEDAQFTKTKDMKMFNVLKEDLRTALDNTFFASAFTDGTLNSSLFGAVNYGVREMIDQFFEQGSNKIYAGFITRLMATKLSNSVDNLNLAYADVFKGDFAQERIGAASLVADVDRVDFKLHMQAALPSPDSLLCYSTAAIIRGFFTELNVRTQSPQYMYASLAEHKSPHMLDTYRLKLPMFYQHFNAINHKAKVFRSLLSKFSDDKELATNMIVPVARAIAGLSDATVGEGHTYLQLIRDATMQDAAKDFGIDDNTWNNLSIGSKLDLYVTSGKPQVSHTDKTIISHMRLDPVSNGKSSRDSEFYKMTSADRYTYLYKMLSNLEDVSLAMVGICKDLQKEISTDGTDSFMELERGYSEAHKAKFGTDKFTPLSLISAYVSDKKDLVKTFHDISSLRNTNEFRLQYGVKDLFYGTDVEAVINTKYFKSAFGILEDYNSGAGATTVSKEVYLDYIKHLVHLSRFAYQTVEVSGVVTARGGNVASRGFSGGGCGCSINSEVTYGGGRDDDIDLGEFTNIYRSSIINAINVMHFDPFSPESIEVAVRKAPDDHVNNSLIRIGELLKYATPIKNDSGFTFFSEMSSNVVRFDREFKAKISETAEKATVKINEDRAVYLTAVLTVFNTSNYDWDKFVMGDGSLDNEEHVIGILNMFAAIDLVGMEIVAAYNPDASGVLRTLFDTYKVTLHHVHRLIANVAVATRTRLNATPNDQPIAATNGVDAVDLGGNTKYINITDMGLANVKQIHNALFNVHNNSVLGTKPLDNWRHGNALTKGKLLGHDLAAAAAVPVAVPPVPVLASTYAMVHTWLKPDNDTMMYTAIEVLRREFTHKGDAATKPTSYVVYPLSKSTGSGVEDAAGYADRIMAKCAYNIAKSHVYLRTKQVEINAAFKGITYEGALDELLSNATVSSNRQVTFPLLMDAILQLLTTVQGGTGASNHTILDDGVDTLVTNVRNVTRQNDVAGAVTTMIATSDTLQAICNTIDLALSMLRVLYSGGKSTKIETLAASRERANHEYTAVLLVQLVYLYERLRADTYLTCTRAAAGDRTQHIAAATDNKLVMSKIYGELYSIISGVYSYYDRYDKVRLADVQYAGGGGGVANFNAAAPVQRDNINALTSTVVTTDDITVVDKKCNDVVKRSTYSFNNGGWYDIDGYITRVTPGLQKLWDSILRSGVSIAVDTSKLDSIARKYEQLVKPKVAAINAKIRRVDAIEFTKVEIMRRSDIKSYALYYRETALMYRKQLINVIKRVLDDNEFQVKNPTQYSRTLDDIDKILNAAEIDIKIFAVNLTELLNDAMSGALIIHGAVQYDTNSTSNMARGTIDGKLYCDQFANPIRMLYAMNNGNVTNDVDAIAAAWAVAGGGLVGAQAAAVQAAAVQAVVAAAAPAALYTKVLTDIVTSVIAGGGGGVYTNQMNDIVKRRLNDLKNPADLATTPVADYINYVVQDKMVKRIDSMVRNDLLTDVNANDLFGDPTTILNKIPELVKLITKDDPTPIDGSRPNPGREDVALMSKIKASPDLLELYATGIVLYTDIVKNTVGMPVQSGGPSTSLVNPPKAFNVTYHAGAAVGTRMANVNVANAAFHADIKAVMMHVGYATGLTGAGNTFANIDRAAFAAHEVLFKYCYHAIYLIMTQACTSDIDATGATGVAPVTGAASVDGAAAGGAIIGDVVTNYATIGGGAGGAISKTGVYQSIVNMLIGVHAVGGAAADSLNLVDALVDAAPALAALTTDTTAAAAAAGAIYNKNALQFGTLMKRRLRDYEFVEIPYYKEWMRAVLAVAPAAPAPWLAHAAQADATAKQLMSRFYDDAYIHEDLSKYTAVGGSRGGMIESFVNAVSSFLGGGGSVDTNKFSLLSYIGNNTRTDSHLYTFGDHINSDFITEIVDGDNRRSVREMIVNSLAGTKKQETSKGRKNDVIRMIYELNINPINVHSMQRFIPFANIYNYSYTLDRFIYTFFNIQGKPFTMINDEVHGKEDETKNLTINELFSSNKEDLSLHNNRDVVKTTFLKMIMNPYIPVDTIMYGLPDSTHAYIGPVGRILRGTGALGMGTPKFLSDQLLSKALLNSMYLGQKFGDTGIEESMGNLLKYTTRSLDRTSVGIRTLGGPNIGTYNTREPDDDTLNKKSKVMNRLTYYDETDKEVKWYDLEQMFGSDPIIAPQRVQKFREEGYERFNTQIVRTSIFAVNLQRFMRIVTNQWLTKAYNLVENGHRAVAAEVTERRPGNEINQGGDEKYDPMRWI
jgi:hypothetical protein